MRVSIDPLAPIARPSAVLFACNMNVVRSPMAEALLKRRLGTRVYVDSCGARHGELDPFVVEVMAEIGIDMNKHQGSLNPTWCCTAEQACGAGLFTP